MDWLHYIRGIAICYLVNVGGNLPIADLNQLGLVTNYNHLSIDDSMLTENHANHSIVNLDALNLINNSMFVTIEKFSI
jgi:hypothetical protein